MNKSIHRVEVCSPIIFKHIEDKGFLHRVAEHVHAESFSDLRCVMAEYRQTMIGLVTLGLREVFKQYEEFKRETPMVRIGDQHSVVETYYRTPPGQKQVLLDWTGVRYLSSAEGSLVVQYDVERGLCHQARLRCYIHRTQLHQAFAFLDALDRVIKGTKRTLLSGEGELLELDRPYTWEELVLPEPLKQTLNQQIQVFIQKRNLFEALHIPFKRGVLLYGAPGNGKTLLGKVLASQVDANFIWVTPKTFDQAGVKAVEAVFSLARLIQPAIVFYEDIDLLGGNSRFMGVRSLLGELLNQLDGLLTNTGVITIATTNFCKELDKALSHRPGRFDLRMEFPNPRPQERHSLLTRALDGIPISPPLLAWTVDRTEGASCAQTVEVVYRAKLLAVEEAFSQDGVVIDAKHIEQACQQIMGQKRAIGFQNNHQVPAETVQGSG